MLNLQFFPRFEKLENTISISSPDLPDGKKWTFMSDQISRMKKKWTFVSDQICGMKKKWKLKEKNEKNMNFFIFFSFFFRSESSFRFGSDLKVHFFFIPRFLEIFRQTSSLIVFILKLQVYDNVKHKPAFFQFWFLHLFPPSQP